MKKAKKLRRLSLSKNCNTISKCQTQKLNNIQNSNAQILEDIIIKMTADKWRLIQLFDKITNKLEPNQKQKYNNQLRYFKRSMENSLLEANMRLVDLTNQIYDIGMAATAINIDDFEPDEQLIVDNMIEPLIMQKSNIKKQATVNLRKVSI